MIAPRHAFGLVVLVALAGWTPTSASGQLPQASAAALGLGENLTAAPRGFAAVANNPAGLGLENGPGASLAIPAVYVEAGFGPVSLSDLAQWEGRLLPDAVRDEWLARVIEGGGQGGTMSAGATPFAFSIGRFGVQLSSVGVSRARLGPDAVELMLYGNAGRTGQAEDFDLEGSSLDGFVLTTGALAFGTRVSPGFHVGVTAKYTVGSGLLVARDDGSSLESDPLRAEIQFPVLFPGGDSFEFNRGSGIGFDIGAIWTGPSVTLGATIQNLVSTFEWDVDGFTYVAGSALFEQGTSESSFEELPASAAPAFLRAAAADMTLKPVFSVGARFEPTSVLAVSADVRKRVSGGLGIGPDFHAGVGAELGVISFLPLRAHLAAVSDGVQVGGGAGLVLGPFNLNGGIALRTGDFENATLGMVTISFGGS